MRGNGKWRRKRTRLGSRSGWAPNSQGVSGSIMCKNCLSHCFQCLSHFLLNLLQSQLFPLKILQKKSFRQVTSDVHVAKFGTFQSYLFLTSWSIGMVDHFLILETHFFYFFWFLEYHSLWRHSVTASSLSPFSLPSYLPNH